MKPQTGTGPEVNNLSQSDYHPQQVLGETLKNYYPKQLFSKASTTLSGLSLKMDREFSFQTLSGYLDQRGQEKQQQFGELTRFVGSQIKNRVTAFTGKPEYKVGDITREVIRRIWEREYETEDVVLTLKVLLALGIALTPIASHLPIDVLIEAMNTSLAQQAAQHVGEQLLKATVEDRVLVQIANLGLVQPIGAKVLGIVTKEIDERLKLVLTGDKNYTLDDKTKAQLMAQVAEFTGRTQYQVGDMSRRINELVSRQETRELKLGEAFRGMKLWDAQVVEAKQRVRDEQAAIRAPPIDWSTYRGPVFEE